MSLKSQAMQIALSQKRAQQKNSESTAERNRAAAFAVPQISSAQQAYLFALYAPNDNAKNVGNASNASPNQSASSSADNQSTTVQRLRAAYLSALASHGFDEKQFTAVPSCDVCNDTGFSNGRLCACTAPLYLAALNSLCKAERFPFTFDESNFSAVKDATLRGDLQKTYALMKQFAIKYPSTTRNTFLFSGATGTGKTCLAQAEANAFLRRGLSVKYCSAYEFNSSMLAVHTSPLDKRASLMDDFLTSDLLVVDDLGTEPMLKNVTCEYLLMVLNERQLNNLPTVYTTNLSLSNLLDRYGERFFSRLTDKSRSVRQSFTGEDMRH